MTARTAILVSLAVGLGSSSSDPPATTAPLIEFSYTDSPWAPDSAPEIQQCGYYILIRGTIGHSGGFRPGAFVQLHGDTLVATVSKYAASVFDPRDQSQARWTLRIGALERRQYHVMVVVTGSSPVHRDVRPSFRQEGCAG